MSELQVLVSVPTPDGDAGVLVDASGDVWLSAHIDRLGGPRLEGHQPDQLGLAGDRSLVGGRLPPGAVGAEVIDDAGRRIRATTGNGAWVALLDEPTVGPQPASWCWDDNGDPIAPELPAGWSRVRVTDADESCPACGRTLWHQVTATDDSRGMRSIRGTSPSPTPTPSLDDHYAGTEPTPFVVCAACGYEESVGAIMRFATPDDPAEANEHQQRYQQALRDHERDKRNALANLTFPVYANHAQSGRMTGWGSSGDQTDSVTVQHGADADQDGPTLQIETDQNDHHQTDYLRAREELERWLKPQGAEIPTERSDAGMIIAWRVRDRKQRQLAATAAREQLEILIDGYPELFVSLRSDDCWVAVRRHNNQTITIAAQQVDPASLDLRPLKDPVADLDWDQSL